MISLINDTIKRVQSSLPVFKYVGSKLLEHEQKMFIGEASKSNQFDELNSMRDHLKGLQNRDIIPYVVENGVMRICIFDAEGKAEEIFKKHAHEWSIISGTFFGEIKNRKNNSQKLTVFLCCNRNPKKIPSDGRPLSPFCINGGYTYPCMRKMIMIYRLEECSRVLIHELFHAFCTDRERDSTEVREAKTEAWTEFFWCILTAYLRGTTAIDVIMIQEGWIRAQNRRILQVVGEKGAEYGRRYTILKQEYWNELLAISVPAMIFSQKKRMIADGEKHYSLSQNSLSFTYLGASNLSRTISRDL